MTRRVLTTLAWWVLFWLPMALVLLTLTYGLIAPGLELPEIGLWRREAGRILSDEWLSLPWGSALLWTTMFKLVPETPEILAYLSRFKARPAFSSARAKDAVFAERHAAAAAARDAQA